MKRFARCFVMWLLVLALPVQAFAASTMLLCGGGHHGTVESAHGGHDHASHRLMGSQHVAVAVEFHVHDPAAVAASHEGSAVGTPSAKHDKVMGKCSVCAACCTVAFLPTAVMAFTAPAPDRALAVVELITRVGFFTDGPDRPPRLFLT